MICHEEVLPWQPMFSPKRLDEMLRRFKCIHTSVAAWVYDGIISSGVNRWGRDVHCIVGVIGKSSHTLCRS